MILLRDKKKKTEIFLQKEKEEKIPTLVMLFIFIIYVCALHFRESHFQNDLFPHINRCRSHFEKLFQTSSKYGEINFIDFKGVVNTNTFSLQTAIYDK